VAISRAQIPEQVDIFQNGGDVDSKTLDEINTIISDRGDFEKSFKKYQERLSPYTSIQPRINIYEAAAELGKGLLSTPNVGGASAFTGLGVGFTKISERIQEARNQNEKSRQEVAMLAAQMAMEDEAKALEFLQEYELKQLDLKNKRGEILTFEYKDKDGKTVQRTVRDNVANDSIIDDLINNKGAIEVRTPTTQVNLPGQASPRDKEAIAAQFKAEEEIIEKERAGIASINNINEAIAIAERLTEENFGTIAKATLYPRKLLSGLGLTDENQDRIIGDQILLSQISMGFTMDIVSRTKGAISNREMDLFISASPGLGSNYDGFMKQAQYLKRIAMRDKEFGKAYQKEAERLEDLELKGELTPSQVSRKLRRYESEWYDTTYYDAASDSFITDPNAENVKTGNLIFSADEKKEINSIVNSHKKGEIYIDDKGNEYIIPKDFDPDLWRKQYREGQDTEIKSAYTLNKNAAVNALERKRQEIESDTRISEEDKKELLAEIDKLLS
jgi:hypothetical protein